MQLVLCTEFVSAIIKLWGLRVIEKIFPSIVVGPVIMIIGLSLAPVGVNMAKTNWLIALSVLVTAIAIVVYSKGLVKLIPIFIGIVVGYIISIISGLVDFTSVTESAVVCTSQNLQDLNLVGEPLFT